MNVTKEDFLIVFENPPFDKEKESEQMNNEVRVIIELEPCNARELNSIKNVLEELDIKKLGDYLERKFFNKDLMDLIACIVNTIFKKSLFNTNICLI